MQDNEEWMSGMYALNEKVNHILLRFLPFYQRPMAFSVRHHSFAPKYLRSRCWERSLTLNQSNCLGLGRNLKEFLISAIL